MVTYNHRANCIVYVLYMQKYAIMQPGLYKNSLNVKKTRHYLNNLLILLLLLQLRPSAPISIFYNGFSMLLRSFFVICEYMRFSYTFDTTSSASKRVSSNPSLPLPFLYKLDLRQLLNLSLDIFKKFPLIFTCR